MRRARSVATAATSRRAALLAGGSALALRRSRGAVICGESYLQLLLRRRLELTRVIAQLGDATERLNVNRASPFNRRRLGSAPRAEARASQALDRLEWLIAQTPAETLGDIGLKLGMLAALQGYAGPIANGWREAFTVEEQLLRSLIADVERLNIQHDDPTTP